MFQTEEKIKKVILTPEGEDDKYPAKQKTTEILFDKVVKEKTVMR